MLSLFSTSSDKAGFRLQYMEVFNWGTFHNKVFRINPNGNNSLLTGANASGKSTFIDALLTLLVPVKKDRFYNQSSGVDKKGDRTEETYVCGHYGTIHREGEHSITTQALRDKSTYSVILANYSNTDQKTITIFQVRWFTNGELKRAYGLAHIPLTIEKDFSGFDGKGLWKKRLDKIYNSNTNKNKIEFLDGPNSYGERIAHLFGMLSTKALSLFNQVVGVKVLEDLNEFIRANMLEEQDAENEFVQLKESFLTLMDAKINIEKAKEQISQLTPINALAESLEKISIEKTRLSNSRDIAVFWFTKQTIYLCNKELINQAEEHKILQQKSAALRAIEKDLRSHQTTLLVQIKSDEVGNKVEELKSKIISLEGEKASKISRLNSYNSIAQKILLDSNPTDEVFKSNRRKSQELKLEYEQKIEIENQDLRKHENEKDRLNISANELTDTIEILFHNKNNIPKREAEIRAELLEYLKATKEEIPFIGELIKVKEEDFEWETSVEKVLHDFGLRLIVPFKYYHKVNEYVNSKNLKGRIRYYKYEDRELLTNMRTFEHNKKDLINKIEIKSNTPYFTWIEQEIRNQYNFHCADDLADFDRFSEMAVTKTALIKFKKGRHEKDDRQHVLKKENFILGWDNRDKIGALKVELSKIHAAQLHNSEAVKKVKAQIANLGIFRDNCQTLLTSFEQFEDLNWQYAASEIVQLEKQKQALEQKNNRVQALLEQLQETEDKLNQLTEITLLNISREILLVEKSQNELANNIHEAEKLLNEIDTVDIMEFEQAHPELLDVTYKSISERQAQFQKSLSEQITKLDNKRREDEWEVFNRINNFKNPQEEITSKFKDWRSDVMNLPEAKNLEFINEYRVLLKKLTNDNLPKFEKKFNEYLQETITNKVGDFRMFFENWVDSIKENIKMLNASLGEIHFRNNEVKTYIQLVAPIRINDEVKEFKSLLDNAIPNIREIDLTIDGRKNHFHNHIEPLIQKLDRKDWREKVMDVRSWFTYKAEEFYRETGEKFKTYENMGQLSGGEKAQLTYTILGSAIAYQFGLTKDGLQTNSFRFIAIDEAFKAQDEDKSKYLINLCKQLHLQLLVVTPSDNIHIVEDDITFVHFVERKEEKYSWLYDMHIEQFKEERLNFLN